MCEISCIESLEWFLKLKINENLMPERNVLSQKCHSETDSYLSSSAKLINLITHNAANPDPEKVLSKQ